MASMNVFVAVLFALLLSRADAGSTRLRATAVQRRSAAAATDKIPDGIKRVIEMLENLVKSMDAEQVQDEKDYAAFSEWCVKQQATTQDSIETLQTTIETLDAELAKLYTQRAELQAQIARLKDEIQQTRQQIAMAQEKRGAESAAFQSEQQDFESSIAACNKAIEILKAHYGDGTTQEAERPGFMSFVEVARQLQHSVSRLKRNVQPDLLALIEQPTEFGRHQAKTGEALNIVDQMKILSDTFKDDKQSAIDEEARLQKMFNNLMKEKGELLQSLIAERDTNQQTLNQVNEEIGSKETAKANAEAELHDEQTYLAQVKTQCENTKNLFEMRKKDRADEKMAVQEAMKVLGSGGAGGASFLQLSSSHRRIAVRSRLCPQCQKAAALLTEKAQLMRSQVLAQAAATTMAGNEAVQDVISALEEMLSRIDEDQKMENEHKAWCEDEMSATAAKEAHHQGRIEELKQVIADTIEVIAEKKMAISETNEDIARADKNMDEATAIRAQEKADYEQEHQAYKESLAALNQAIDVLAKFYRSKKGASLEQESDERVAPREVAPGVFDNVYQQKGGAGVIGMISTVRGEFEQGLKDLDAAEAKAVADFAAAKAAYDKMRRDLVDQLNRLTVELQTAQNELEEAKQDKVENEKEVAAAQAYMLQLKSSCTTLLEHFDERVQLRKDEKAAIKEAINVLENEA